MLRGPWPNFHQFIRQYISGAMTSPLIPRICKFVIRPLSKTTIGCDYDSAGILLHILINSVKEKKIPQLHLKVGILVHLLLYLYLKFEILKPVPSPNVCFSRLQIVASWFV
jgi:hypothetical protein